MDKELIVARYREPVAWVLDSPCPATLYNHGPQLDLDHPRIDCIDLPNRGREAGCYLEHICRNYGHLAEWSYFVQAEPHCPVTELWSRMEIKYRDTTPLTRWYKPHFPSGEIKARDRVRTAGPHEVRWGLADHFGDREPDKNREWLDAVWAQFFTGPKPDPWWYGYSASYAVPRHRITDRPLAYWLWLRELANRDAREMTPASAWAFEAVWYYLWGDAAEFPGRRVPEASVALPAFPPAEHRPCGGCGGKAKGPIPVARSKP